MRYSRPMIPNPQYDYDHGPFGPLAALHERAAYPDYPTMIAPPRGWTWIVVDLNDNLSAILPDYTIAEVKEKFSELRFYIDSFGVGDEDPRIALAQELVAEAELKSKTTCQICGAIGTFRTDTATFAVLCDKHSESR